MSTDMLRLIPSDPAFVPAPAAQEAARAKLASYVPRAEIVTATVADTAMFVDQGGEWKRVLCPACGAEVDEAWWVRAVDAAHGSGFANLTARMPCCGATTSLNDLRYDRPAGFARFVLEALNPGTDLNDGQMRSLEGILGCSLRKMWTINEDPPPSPEA